MKTFAFCPISENKIDEYVTRTNAGFTVLIIVSFLIASNFLFVVFLGVDFLLRSLELPKFSLVGISSRNILKYLQVKSKPINAGPKIFAARIGLVLTSMILLGILIQSNLLVIGISLILGIFSFLEFAFGFCVACQIYPYVYVLVYGHK
ncbi:MAG: DUF4395 domain-containing protein [Prolixibacteraceae bacterium]|jgi:hypothetical protein|nr:DUF4395 domain-containing protein [Prolixibacteraceae bacterium]